MKGSIFSVKIKNCNNFKYFEYYHDNVYDYVQHYVLVATIENYETVQLNKDGNPVEVSMSIFPLIDEEGKVMGVSSILRDVSLKKEAEKLKEEFTKKLEISVQNRTRD